MSNATATWESNTSVEEAVALLRDGGAKRAVCLTHAKPDGDAAGSTLAIARSLRRIGVDARVSYVGPAPRWLAGFAGETPIEVVGSGRAFEPGGGEPDLVVVSDTGSWSQLAEASEWLRGRRDRTIVFDHHLHGDGEVGARRVISKDAAATTQVIAPVCAGVLGVEVEGLPLEVASALYMGLATDTQWFRLSNVAPATLRLAADLMQAGVDHTAMYEMIEQQDAASRWMLLGRALSSLELHAGGRVAMMRLTLADFAECGADRNDTGGFADMVLHVASVRVSMVLTEAGGAEGPVTKVSMRSKPGADAIDVNALTRQLGGGGHARAAGAKMTGVTMEEARRRVLGLLT